MRWQSVVVDWFGDIWRGADWQAIGTLVALLGVIGSSSVAIRGQRQDRKIAENTAARAEHAAQLSDANARRVIDALEGLAAAGLGQREALREPKVEWSLAHHRGDAFILENVGDATATAVDVTADESMLGPDSLDGGSSLAPGEALTFTAVVTMGTRDSTITVSWTTEGELEPRRWRYPLPARPPRR